jgi:hypothetical protein
MIKWTFRQLGIGDYGLHFSELYNEIRISNGQLGGIWNHCIELINTLSYLLLILSICIQQKHKINHEHTPKKFPSYCNKIKIECWFKNIVDDQFWWPSLHHNFIPIMYELKRIKPHHLQPN